MAQAAPGRHPGRAPNPAAPAAGTDEPPPFQLIGNFMTALSIHESTANSFYLAF